MKKLSTLIFICLLFLYQLAQAQPDSLWQVYANPEEAGFDSQGIEKMARQYREMQSAAYLVVRNGHVVWFAGDISRRFMCHSMRKSIMSAIYGIYQDEIDLYSTLDEMNLDDKAGLTDREKQARIHDLITSRSGIYLPAAYEPPGMDAQRPERESSKPGATFFYNNWDFNALHTLFEQSTGKNFFDAVLQELAQPLDMQDLRREDMTLRYHPSSNHPAYLFKMSPRDLARLGQLYLQKGKWNGQQIIPETWVTKSTSAYSTDLPGFTRSGYGYLWWVEESMYSEPCFYASGLGGHRLYVFPKSELVIVHSSNTYLNQFVHEEQIQQLVQLTLNACAGQPSPQPVLNPFELPPSDLETARVPKKLAQRYEREYQHSLFGKFEAKQINPYFLLKGNKLGNFRIYPETSSVFRVEDLPELPLWFLKASGDQLPGQAVTEVNEDRIPQRLVLYY